MIGRLIGGAEAIDPVDALIAREIAGRGPDDARRALAVSLYQGLAENNMDDQLDRMAWLLEELGLAGKLTSPVRCDASSRTLHLLDPEYPRQTCCGLVAGLQVAESRAWREEASPRRRVCAGRSANPMLGVTVNDEEGFRPSPRGRRGQPAAAREGARDARDVARPAGGAGFRGRAFRPRAHGARPRPCRELVQLRQRARRDADHQLARWCAEALEGEPAEVIWERLGVSRERLGGVKQLRRLDATAISDFLLAVLSNSASVGRAQLCERSESLFEAFELGDR